MKVKASGAVRSQANSKTPLRDGDIDRLEDEAYADSMFPERQQQTGPSDRGQTGTADP